MKPENRPKIKFDGREYDDYQATQMQRRIERQIRTDTRLKKAYEAAGLEKDAQNSKIRLRQLNKKYREFSKAAGLPEQRERMKVRYVDDASKAKAAKRLENAAKSGIIKVNKPKEIPDVGRPGALTAKDVTKMYLDSATPGQGSITYDAGYKVSGHQAEIKMAKWIHSTFGGDIKLLKEAEDDSIKRPDYLWHTALWELKGVHSISAADKRLQYAIKQIKDNPGGVILDVLEDIDMDKLERQLSRRFYRPESKIDDLDLMILLKGDLVKILRYKK